MACKITIEEIKEIYSYVFGTEDTPEILAYEFARLCAEEGYSKAQLETQKSQMTNFRNLAEKLANSLRDANELLAYLNEKNLIDDEEPIMKTWELLGDATDALAEPEDDLIEDALNDIKLAKEVESLPDFDLIINALENVSAIQEELSSYRTELSKVMPKDCKDWWENPKSEWPSVAAGAIVSLREREELAWKQVAEDDFKTQMRIEFLPRLNNFGDFLYDCDSSMRSVANTFRVLLTEIEERL